MIDRIIVLKENSYGTQERYHLLVLNDDLIKTRGNNRRVDKIYSIMKDEKYNSKVDGVFGNIENDVKESGYLIIGTNMLVYEENLALARKFQDLVFEHNSQYAKKQKKD